MQFIDLNAQRKRIDGKLSDQVHDMKFEGFGLSFEADQVARCLRGELLRK